MTTDTDVQPAEHPELSAKMKCMELSPPGFDVDLKEDYLSYDNPSDSVDLTFSHDTESDVIDVHAMVTGIAS